MPCGICHAPLRATGHGGRPRRYCPPPNSCVRVAQTRASARFSARSRERARLHVPSFQDPYAGLAAAVYAQAHADARYSRDAARQREAHAWLARQAAQGLWRDLLHAALQAGMD